MNPTTIDDLEQVCCAAWFVQTRLHAETAGDDGPNVDAALYEASGTHLDTLLRILDYHVGEESEVAAEIADIRSGTGYQDRASDLLRAATLFDTWEDELKEDKRRCESSIGLPFRGAWIGSRRGKSCSTARNVKRRMPPRQSRGNSRLG